MGDHVRKPAERGAGLPGRFSLCLLSLTLTFVGASGCAVSRGDLGTTPLLHRSGNV
jgi:hypothetical protein